MSFDIVKWLWCISCCTFCLESLYFCLDGMFLFYNYMMICLYFFGSTDIQVLIMLISQFFYDLAKKENVTYETKRFLVIIITMFYWCFLLVTYILNFSANKLGADALFVYTKSGHVASLLSQCRPDCPIYAFTPSMSVRRRMNLQWGLIPFCLGFSNDEESTLNKTFSLLKAKGMIKSGDTIISVSDMLQSIQVVKVPWEVFTNTVSILTTLLNFSTTILGLGSYHSLTASSVWDRAIAWSQIFFLGTAEL